jgi:DNA-binding LacI/PurR family transcriptional regulator
VHPDWLPRVADNVGETRRQRFRHFIVFMMIPMATRPPAGPRLSVIDVAAAAQVSIGTVSRVINGNPAVLPANVEAVRRAMEALGYRPAAPENRRGRRRPALRPPRVALLLMGDYDLTWMTDRSPVYSYVMHGMQAAFAEQGCDLVIRHLPTHAALGALLRHQELDGALLFGPEPADAPPAELARVPAVWVMGWPRRFTGDRVLPNHRHIGMLAAEHLLAAGQRVCGFLGWDLSRAGALAYDGAQRGLAFGAALAAGGGRMIAVPQEGLHDRQRNRTNEVLLGQRLAELFDQREPPTALFLAMDVYAPSVYRFLQARGLRPMRDVQVVTCNNEQPFLAGLDPAPAVIDLHAADIGRRAAERLRWRIAHPTAPVEEILVAPSMVPQG